MAQPLMNSINTDAISNPHLRSLISLLHAQTVHAPETAQLSQNVNTVLAGPHKKDSPRYNDTYHDEGRHIDHTHDDDWGNTHHQDYHDYSDHSDYCD